MRTNFLVIGAALLALVGCSGPESADNGANAANAVDQVGADKMVDPALADTLASDRDSTSPAAAGRLVEDYAALAEKGEFTEAARSWTHATAAAQFASSLEDYPKVELTAGKPKGEEGAAGSVFITVPLTLDLTLRSGSPYQMLCKATLRRVNDVPGSTAEQRRWHIETIAC